MKIFCLWRELSITVHRRDLCKPNIRRMGTLFFLVLILIVSSRAVSAAMQSQASITVYGTFQAAGISIDLANTEDPNKNATATVEYQAGSEPFRRGFPLTRVSPTRFVGSLFGLEPGTTYTVRVTLSDPDGGALQGLLLSASVTTRTEISLPTAKKRYFVGPSGSGSVCDKSQPCALNTGLTSVGPGEEVVLLSGVYYAGDLLLAKSGTASAPIVIRGDGTAIIDGADPTQFSWQADGNIYHTTTNVADANLVTANGSRLYPYATLGELRRLVWGISGFYVEGKSLYVHLAQDTNPNKVKMAVSRYNTAIQVVEQNYIYFSNLTFRHYGQGTWAKTLYFKDANYNLVQNSTFASTQQGIAIQDNSSGNVIQGNEFYDTIYGWPWDSVKDGTELERGGLRILNQTIGRGTIIRGNTFHDLFDGFGVCPNQPFDGTNETDVYNNIMYRIVDDGMETDGWCSNVRIWNNTIYDTLTGISLAPAMGGPLYAIRNLIYRIGLGNNDASSGASFKFNSNGEASGAIYLLHNTVDAFSGANNNNSGLDIKKLGAWSSLYIRNNIWFGYNRAVRNANIEQPIDMDYNALWSQTGNTVIQWSDSNYTELEVFSSATGLEQHSYHVDPSFANSIQGNYSLSQRSPLIDAGVVLPGINDNYAGAGPDIGAIEIGGSVAHPPMFTKVFFCR